MSKDLRAKVSADEDEDLDDLDDVLDQFSAKTQPQKPPYSTTTSAASAISPPFSPSSIAPEPSRSPAPPDPSSSLTDFASDDFTAELAKGMESLMSELGFDPKTGGLGGAPPGPGAVDKDDKDLTEAEKKERDEQQKAFAAAWEAMLLEEMNAPQKQPSTTPGASTSSSTSKGPVGAAGPERPPTGPQDYQTRLRDAMNKMNASESTLKDGQAAFDPSNPMEALLAQLAGGAEGAESEDEMKGMLEMIMGQLMSKDVLYEPLKELSDKFPDYLAKNASALSEADKTRYDAQVINIKSLLDVFNEPGFSDTDSKYQDRVMKLMEELQKHGSPPEEIMGPLPEGFSMGADGMPNMPEGCIVC